MNYEANATNQLKKVVNSYQPTMTHQSRNSNFSISFNTSSNTIQTNGMMPKVSQLEDLNQTMTPNRFSQTGLNQQNVFTPISNTLNPQPVNFFPLSPSNQQITLQSNPQNLCSPYNYVPSPPLQLNAAKRSGENRSHSISSYTNMGNALTPSSSMANKFSNSNTNFNNTTAPQSNLSSNSNVLMKNNNNNNQISSPPNTFQNNLNSISINNNNNNNNNSNSNNSMNMNNFTVSSEYQQNSSYNIDPVKQSNSSAISQMNINSNLIILDNNQKSGIGGYLKIPQSGLDNNIIRVSMTNLPTSSSTSSTSAGNQKFFKSNSGFENSNLNSNYSTNSSSKQNINSNAQLKSNTPNKNFCQQFDIKSRGNNHSLQSSLIKNIENPISNCDYDSLRPTETCDSVRYLQSSEESTSPLSDSQMFMQRNKNQNYKLIQDRIVRLEEVINEQDREINDWQKKSQTCSELEEKLNHNRILLENYKQQIDTLNSTINDKNSIIRARDDTIQDLQVKLNMIIDENEKLSEVVDQSIKEKSENQTNEANQELEVKLRTIENENQRLRESLEISRIKAQTENNLNNLSQEQEMLSLQKTNKSFEELLKLRDSDLLQLKGELENKNLIIQTFRNQIESVKSKMVKFFEDEKIIETRYEHEKLIFQNTENQYKERLSMLERINQLKGEEVAQMKQLLFEKSEQFNTLNNQHIELKVSLEQKNLQLLKQEDSVQESREKNSQLRYDQDMLENQLQTLQIINEETQNELTNLFQLSRARQQQLDNVLEQNNQYINQIQENLQQIRKLQMSGVENSNLIDKLSHEISITQIESENYAFSCQILEQQVEKLNKLIFKENLEKLDFQNFCSVLPTLTDSNNSQSSVV